MSHTLASGEKDLGRGAIADIEIPSPGGRPNPSGHQALQKVSSPPCGEVAAQPPEGRTNIRYEMRQTL